MIETCMSYGCGQGCYANSLPYLSRSTAVPEDEQRTGLGTGGAIVIVIVILLLLVAAVMFQSGKEQSGFKYDHSQPIAGTGEHYAEEFINPLAAKRTVNGPAYATDTEA